MVIKESQNDIANKFEKEMFQTVIKKTAIGLHSKFESAEHKKDVQRAVDDFVVFLSKNLDGPTFTKFNKILNELRSDVLNNKGH